ncbi:MAG: hypothetical protein QF752_08665 [Planctomycetota bacterium]|nr:hypothetical protein [Planctomycetota bacterium]
MTDTRMIEHRKGKRRSNRGAALAVGAVAFATAFVLGNQLCVMLLRSWSIPV